MQKKRQFDTWKILPLVALAVVLIFVWFAYVYNSMPDTQIEYIDVAMYDLIFLSSFLIGTSVFYRAINKRMSKS